jgi:hypothetical protein
VYNKILTTYINRLRFCACASEAALLQVIEHLTGVGRDAARIPVVAWIANDQLHDTLPQDLKPSDKYWHHRIMLLKQDVLDFARRL